MPSNRQKKYAEMLFRFCVHIFARIVRLVRRIDNPLILNLQLLGDIDERLEIEMSGIGTKTDWKIVMDLSNTNLSGANLMFANLSEFHLWESDLRNAKLMFVNLSGAYLSDAKLSGAILSDANVSGAYLSGANLKRMLIYRVLNLLDADLLCAILSNVEGLDTAKNLDTVKLPPQEIIDVIVRRKRVGQK